MARHHDRSEKDPKITARDERQSPDTEKLLRQFLNHDGPKGSSGGYGRRHDFMFAWNEAKKARLMELMRTHGYDFDQAFEQIDGEEA